MILLLSKSRFIAGFDVLPEWLMGCDVPMTSSPSIVEPRHVTAFLSPDELSLLTAYRNASEDVQKAAIAMLEAVTQLLTLAESRRRLHRITARSQSPKTKTGSIPA